MELEKSPQGILEGFLNVGFERLILDEVVTGHVGGLLETHDVED